MHDETSSETIASPIAGQPQAASVRFSDLSDSEAVVESLRSSGYSKPTALQVRLIPALKSAEKVCITGSVGSGKTLGYAIALAGQALGKGRQQTLVVSDSVDRIQAINDTFKSLGVTTSVVTTGSPASADAAVVLGVTAAVLPAIRDNSLDAGRFSSLVLDAVDRSPSTIISDDVESILSAFIERSPRKQVLVVGRSKSLGIAGLLSKFFGGDVTEISEGDEQGAQVEHLYCELGNDILAKPNTLCDIIQGFGLPPTAVFCNAPSDVDLVDAILRKKGINAKKLIGHIPEAAAADLFRRCLKGEITVLVLTDLSSRGLPLENLELVINYSTHNDPETYLHRMGAGDGKLKRVVSLINPIDLSNFHYVRRILDLDFRRMDPPAPALIGASRFEALKGEATRSGKGNDEKLQTMADLVLKDPSARDIVAYLLDNTLTVIPELRDAEGRQGSRGPRDEQGGERGGYDRGGYDRGDSGRGRGRDRGGRRDNRGYQDDRRQNDSGAPREARGEFGDQGGYADQGGEGYRDDQPREGRRDSRRREDGPPPKRDIRIYLGHGQRDQFSESALSGILTKLELNPAETIQRFSLRDSYAFVDLPEDKAEAILGKLEGAEVSPGVGLFFRKATIISAPREQGAAGDEGQFAEGEGSQQEFRDDGGQGENQESGEQFGQAEGDVGSESADFANDAK